METQRHALVKRDYLVPFVLVTSLFFLWGFAHAILDVLNKHFQEVMDITRTHSAMVQVFRNGCSGRVIHHQIWIS